MPSPSVVYANNLTGELDGGFAAGETELTLASADGWPVIPSGKHAWLTIYNDDHHEIVKATGRNDGSRNVTIVRAQGGTTARAWADGDKVDIRITKELLDDLSIAEIVDIRGDALPVADASQVGRIYLDRLHSTAYFVRETIVAQTDAMGVFTAYRATDVVSYLGVLQDDSAAVQHVAQIEADIGKFYFSNSQHIFRRWTRTTLLGGLFDWHWSTIYSPASYLATAQNFATPNNTYYLGYANGDETLRSRIPADIADAARAYGVTPSGGVRYIDGDDFTAAVNYQDTFDWATLAVPGISGVTTDVLNSAINALRTEIVDGAPDNRNTLAELATALAAVVTNAVISNIASTESTSIAPSRRQVATELANVRADIIEARASRDVTGETGRRVPTLLYSDATGAALGTANTALLNIDVDDDPNDFEVILIEAKVTGDNANNTLPMKIYATFRESDNWPTTETTGTGVLLFDTVSNTGLVNIWRTSATRLSLRKGGSQAGWASVTVTIHRIWGVATVDDWLALAAGTDYALLPGAKVTLGGATAGQADGTLANAVRTLLGYAATVTSVTLAHAGSAVTLTVVYTTNAPAAGLRPAGIDFLGERWLAADITPAVITDNVTGVSTVTLAFDVPARVASSATEVEALRSTTAYDLHWLVPFTTLAEGARLPAAAAERTTDARAEYNATTKQWELVDADETVEGADQTDVQATIILWGRFAAEPTSGPNAAWGDDGYAGLQSHADIGTSGAWQISEEDANLQGNAANPLYIAIAQATRTSGVWAQSPEWAIVPVDLPTQYSADGINWHTTYVAATDSWVRYRTSSGAWSRPLSLLGPQAVLHWTTIATMNFNNMSSGSRNISITPTWLNQYRELRVQALEFLDWPSYTSQAYEQVREARIGLDHVEALAHNVGTSVIDAGITNNPIACRFAANEAFIGLGSDTDLSGSGIRWPFNFSFVFRGDNGVNYADGITILSRPPSWSWCYVKIDVR